MGYLLGFVVIVGFIWAVRLAAKDEAKLKAQIQMLHQELIACELDRDQTKAIVTILQGLKVRNRQELTKPIYDSSLEILEANPTSTIARQLALDLARWHYSNTRQDGKLTIYDEQAIHNDIFARSGSAAVAVP